MGSVSAVCPSAVRCGKPDAHHKPKKAEPCLGQAVLDYLNTWSGAKNVGFKATSQVLEAVTMIDPSKTGIKSLWQMTKDGKNFGDASEIPKKSVDVYTKVSEFYANPSMPAFGEVIYKITSWYVPFFDAFNTVHKYVGSLSDRVMNIMGIAHNSSTLTAMSFGVNEEIAKIAEATARAAKDKARRPESAAQVTNSQICIARNLHYACLGAFSLAAKIVGFTSPALLMWTFATGGVVTTIAAAVHKEMYLPKKGEEEPKPAPKKAVKV